MDDIIIKYRWTADELLHGYHWHYRQNVRRFFRIALFVLGCLMMFAGIVTVKQFGPDYWSIVLVVVGFVIVIGNRFINPWVHRRRFTKRPDKDSEIEWRISAESIRSRSARGSSEIVWSGLAKVVQTPEGFLFYSIPQLFYWIPRNGFSSEVDFERLSQLAREHAREFRRVT